MGADIENRLLAQANCASPPEDELLREAAAEIGRLRGEVEAMHVAYDAIRPLAPAASVGINGDGAHAEEIAGLIVRDVSELDPGDPDNSWVISVHVRDLNRIAARHIAPLLATPAPAMPNGVEGLSPAWHCTNCRNTFTATDALWKGHSDRCAPKCPNCKADSQYTYPEGVGGLIDKLEHYGFECQGGALTNCSEWSELIRALRAADNRDAAGVDSEEDAYVIERMGKLLAEIAVIVNGPEPDMTRWSYHDLPDKVRALKTTPAAVPAGEAVAERVARDMDANDGHSDSCACMHPGDRECNCHKAYGFATAEAMDAADCKHDYRETADDRLPSSWIDVCAKCGHERGTIYTTPPAPVQAAPQEGAPRWVDDCQGKASYDGALVSVSVRTWPGNYSADNRPSGKIDVLRLGKVVQSIEVSADTETQLRAEIESKVAKLAAHHSACELVVDDAMVERVCRNHFPDWDMYGPVGKMVRFADIRRLLTAALQHRGDSQEVGRG